jgi:hypothetical protein
MIGRRIKPKVYLEGIEIPAYKVTVQTSIGTSALAIIECPPVEEFFDRFEEDPDNKGSFIQIPGVLPRTFVHVFYEDSEDPDDAPRLLFEGEFVSFEYVKLKDRRAIRMLCRDVSNLLSSIYVRFYSDFFTPYGNLMSVFQGTGTEEAKTQNIRLAIIQAAGFNPEVLEAIKSDEDAGFGIGSAFRRIVDNGLLVNSFFADFNDRTKIKDKIVTFVDTKSRELLEATRLESLIQQNMSNLKENATVWDLYTMLMSLVFYLPVPIPAAPYLKDSIVDTGITGRSFSVTPENTLASLLIKPYTWWTSPPNFNVIFPSQYKTFTMNRDFLKEPTRLIMSAFGVLESLAQEELKRAAPSSYLFIAPAALASKFDSERFDTRIQLSGGEEKTFRQIEEDLRRLRREKSSLEVQLANERLGVQTKQQIQADIAEKDADIEIEENNLDAALTELDRTTAIQEAQASTNRHQNVSARLWNRNILTDQDGVSLASREDLKGIVFAFDYLTQTQVEVTKAKGISPLALQNYLSKVANYKLTLQQYMKRGSTMQLHFSPQIVAGFPALVVDPNRNFFGEVDVVTHILDAEGLADTQVQLSFVRNDEVEFTEFERNVPGKIQFPTWINPLYLPQSIGTNIYQRLFPANKPDATKPGIQAADAISPAFGANQIVAARKIRDLYFKNRDPERFAQGFTRRNIASRDQVFLKVLKAVKAGTNFLLNSFGDDRFEAAQRYAVAANKISSFARADAPASSDVDVAV